jgi:hypothetical protein
VRGGTTLRAIGCRVVRRLPRILLNSVTAISLLSCVAALTLCVRGRWVREQVFFAQPGGRMWLLRSQAEGLGVHVADGWAGPRRDWGYGRSAAGEVELARSGQVRPYFFRHMGALDRVTPRRFGITTSRELIFISFGTDGRSLSFVDTYADFTGYSPQFRFMGPETLVRGIFVPYWIVVSATALLPLGRVAGWLGRRAVRRGRLRRGACPACGYDCRATPQRCPECGFAIAGSARVIRPV